MNNLDAILEVAIGLVFSWLILSVATMEVQNIIGKIFNTRAKFLEQSILEMFRDEKDIVEEFYKHPAIKALYRKGAFGRLKKPDYIPNPIFAEAALDIFVNLGVDDENASDGLISIEKIMNKINVMDQENPDLAYAIRRVLPEFDGTETFAKYQQAETKAIEFKTNAENWFDTSMTSASFWYKEKAQTVAFFIGLVLALLINIDTISITEQLWREPTLRQTLIAQAQGSEIDSDINSVSALEEKFEELSLPVGWTTETAEKISDCGWVPGNNVQPGIMKAGQCQMLTALPAMNDGWGWVAKFFGLLFSAVAAMQGAPFWFEMLKKILHVSGKSKKEDVESQPPAAQPPAPPVEAVG